MKNKIFKFDGFEPKNIIFTCSGKKKLFGKIKTSKS